jgi:hypothetical protein
MHRLGSSGFAPSNLYLKSGLSVQPDLFVAPLLPDGQEPIEWPDYGIPILIAEVTSPSTARVRPDHQAAAVPAERRRGVLDRRLRCSKHRPLATGRTSGPRVWTSGSSGGPDRAPESLVMDLVGFFGQVWAERGRASRAKP